jgi:dTDP-4-dehydrorhamnose reductase
VDLLGPGAVEHVVERSRPDWVVHCAAMTNVDDCETNPDLAWKVNSDLVRRVVRVAGKSGARLLYVSTDSVFC